MNTKYLKNSIAIGTPYNILFPLFSSYLPRYMFKIKRLSICDQSPLSRGTGSVTHPWRRESEREGGSRRKIIVIFIIIIIFLKF